MKSKQEIEEYLQALQWGLGAPCGCAASGHRRECEEGARFMKVSIDVLRWVLEQNTSYHRSLVEISLAAYAHHRREGGHEHA